MDRRVALLCAIVGSVRSFDVSRAARAPLVDGRRATTLMTVPLEKANVPLGAVSVNPFQNLKSMQDQRVARISQSEHPICRDIVLC